MIFGYCLVCVDPGLLILKDLKSISKDAFEEEDELVKSLQLQQQRWRLTTDKTGSKNLIWAFGSDEL